MTRKLNFARTGGLAAIGFAVLIVLANLVLVPAGLPLTGAETGDVVAFFTAHAGITGIGTAVIPLAWVLATVFGAAAVAVLWPAERERGDAWSLVGFAGLLLQNATFASVVAIRLALGLDPDAPLWPLHDALFTLNGTFLALALTGLSLAGRRTGLLAAWHGRLGLVAAALLFASATLTPLVIEAEGPLGLLGLAGWLLWVGWLVGYGVTLLRLPGQRDRR
ncbi:hypothetical protein [Actinophytocola gossypii]|uniref:DUF4386 family protein n=1 Tax=Actinophytocola gossypii TaxID=2812003 RepID=A0ABT2J6G6_9PSEU|nr:hypothetical protein [Actinophytocola gossypii]MCT2583453.1 hypothetical protein [Actinophytocola gossypii]